MSDGWELGLLENGKSNSMLSPVLVSSKERGERCGSRTALAISPMTASAVLPITLASVGLPAILGSAFVFSTFLRRVPGTRPTLDSE